MSLLSRLKSLRNIRRLDHDIDDELRSHLEMRAQDNIAAGMSADEARYDARRRFGNAALVKEDTRSADIVTWLETTAQDLGYGLRSLRKSPGFAAVAILTMALGIGATTAIFSVVDATLLHPLVYPHPEQLVTIVDDLPGAGNSNVGMSVPEWHDFQRSGIFEYVSIIGGGDVNLTGASQPERIRFLNIAPNYFALLGVQPQLGRSFHPDDQTPGFTLEVILSDGLWKRSFGADPRVLGMSLRLDNDLYTIIGVMPPGFHDPGRTADARNIDLWLASGFAAAPAPDPVRSGRFFPDVIARIKPGLTLDQAQHRLDSLVASLQQQFPTDYPAEAAWSVRLVPLKETIVGDVRQSLILLLGAVALVLLIGCANVANLLLARASARRREMAVRQALGAARSRLTRQLLTESLLLSLIGGVTGLVILLFTKDALLRLLPASIPRLHPISINFAVLLFALGSSVVAGVVFGLAPALQVGRIDLTLMLKQESRGSTVSGEQARTRHVLVVTQFALSLVLLIVAALLLRSFWDLLDVRLGFNPRNVVSTRVWLPVPNDPATDIYGTTAQEAAFLREVARRVSTLPGVEEMAISDRAAIPLGHLYSDLRSDPLALEGREIPSGRTPRVHRTAVSPSYFHLLEISTLRGRVFAESDDDKAPPVAIVNQSFAQTYFPVDDPVGKHIKLSAAATAWTTIIGVVSDARTESLDQMGVPQVYVNIFQRRPKDLAILLRGRLDPATIEPQVRAQVQAVDSTLPVFGAQTLNAALSESLSQRRFSLKMVALFALTALVLAAIGIYGVISYIVSERMHEMGIRLALGAQRSDVMGLVLRQGLRLAAAGAALGFIASLMVARLMSGLLYGVKPTDPLTFATVALLLIGVALLACYVPARRAVRVDPMIALRYE